MIIGLMDGCGTGKGVVMRLVDGCGNVSDGRV